MSYALDAPGLGRRCGTCRIWLRDHVRALPSEPSYMVALCPARDEYTRGSDTCGLWTRRPINVEECT